MLRAENPERTTTPLNTREEQVDAHTRSPSPGAHNTQNPQNDARKMRANINIATLNMNGLAAPSAGMSPAEKWTMINQTLNKHKIAVLAIQETHLDQDSAEMIKARYSKKMEIIYSADPNAPRATAGVAFVINKTLIAPKKIVTHKIIPGRALILELQWLETESTSLINIYAPNEKPSHRNFWESIETKRQEKRIAKPNFMLGDFNVTEDPIDRLPVRLDDQTAIEALRGIRQNWGLHDLWRIAHPKERYFTFRAHTNGQHIASRLDRIYVAGTQVPATFDWVITPSAVPTDH